MSPAETLTSADRRPATLAFQRHFGLYFRHLENDIYAASEQMA